MELLEQHFETAFDAPDGIEKLRELILTLAMQGKLIEQNQKDLPANKLLEKLKIEKERLVKEKRVKPPKIVPKIEAVDIPYKLPQSWQWVSLGEVAVQVTDGVHRTPNYLEKGIPFISVKDIDGTTISFSNCKYISKEQHEEINARCNPEKGDLLICRIGTLGRVTIVDTDNPFSLFVSVGLLKFPQQFLTSEFMHTVLRSPLLIKQYDEIKAGGSHTNKLNLGDIPKLVLPIPPLPEQRRIVAKIDHLMARCDELEKLRTERNKKRLTVHTAALNRLLTAQSNDQGSDTFTEAWQFMAQHFSELYSVKENVAELRKAILQLAVMGKLVDQDPSDEPAEILLEKIKSEKKRLIEEGKLRKSTRNKKKSVAQPHWICPMGWVLSNVGELAYQVTDGTHKTPKYVDDGIRFVSAKDIRQGYLTFEQCKYITQEEHAELIRRCNPEFGDILLSKSGSIGTVVAVEEKQEFSLFESLALVKSDQKLLSNKYMKIALQNACNSLTQDQIRGVAVKHLHLNVLRSLIMPLPPLREQHRIVAKVDQLMTLCDTLEQQIDNATHKQTTLLNAVMAQV